MAKNYDSELQWKNWAVYINDTSNAIEELRRLGEVSYFDSSQLNTFYAKLNTFVSTRKPYIDTYDNIKKELDTIGKILFSEKYIDEISRGKKSPKLKKTQNTIMNRLNEQLGKIIEELANTEMLPKVNKIDTDKPGAVTKRNQFV